MKNAILSIAALLGALAPCLASATLGEAASSVQADSKMLGGSVKAQERAGYQVHEIQLPSGTVVREFVGADDKVFAVAWSGPLMPNLRQMLGSYFDTYVAGVKAKRTGRAPVSIHQTGFVAQNGGHMRAFAGRAYLPQGLPAGVVSGDLR